MGARNHKNLNRIASNENYGNHYFSNKKMPRPTQCYKLQKGILFLYILHMYLPIYLLFSDLQTKTFVFLTFIYD